MEISASKLYNLIAEHLCSVRLVRRRENNLEISVVHHKPLGPVAINTPDTYPIVGKLSRRVNNKVREALLKTYLYHNITFLEQSHPTTTFNEKPFLGAERTCFARIETLGTCFLLPCLEDSPWKKDENFVFEHYACLLYTNDYRYGIVLSDPFPECFLLELNVQTLHVTPCPHLLSAMKQILTARPITPPRNLKAPHLPFVLDLKNFLAGGGQGAVFTLPNMPRFVVKIMDITFDSSGQNTLVASNHALKEALILSYLKLRNFKHVPQLESFGYFNGLFFYIIMTNVPGERPRTMAQVEECERALQELHQLGIVHGDLHAGNFKHQFPNNCSILDFGLASLMSEYTPDSEFISQDTTTEMAYEVRNANKHKSGPKTSSEQIAPLNDNIKKRSRAEVQEYYNIQ